MIDQFHDLIRKSASVHAEIQIRACSGDFVNPVQIPIFIGELSGNFHGGSFQQFTDWEACQSQITQLGIGWICQIKRAVRETLPQELFDGFNDLLAEMAHFCDSIPKSGPRMDLKVIL